MKITNTWRPCNLPQTGLFFSVAVQIDPTDNNHIKSTKIKIPFNTINLKYTISIITIKELALSSLDIHK